MADGPQGTPQGRTWRRPGLLVFVAGMLLASLGWALVIDSSRRIPVHRATVDGVALELEQARWILDQMDHGENFQKPSTMMPDMPEWGSQRVTLELSYRNVSDQSRIVDASELTLVPEIGDEVPPMGAQIGQAPLLPGQTFHNAVHFDFDTTKPHGRLRVAWRRDGDQVFLPIPEPADHYHLRPRGGEVALPPDARLVFPLGRAERGEDLYRQVYGCIACHGDPATPGSNIIGPHLASVATAASGRVQGVSALQYLYDSILDPSGFIAPECRDGLPCQEPSAMPEYASLMDLQDVADLLVYLADLQGDSMPTVPVSDL